VRISSASVSKKVCGGETGTGRAENNIVEISSASVGDVCGGKAEVCGEVKDNVVEISSASVGSVWGGRLGMELVSIELVGLRRVGHGTVTSNVVRISSTSVSGSVWGGDGVYGEVKNNVVEISSASVSGKVWGGRINVYGVHGGGGWEWKEGKKQEPWQEQLGEGLVTNNKVRIEGIKVEDNVYGGYININFVGNRWKVEGNEVEIINSDIKGNVYGGYIESNARTIERIVRGNTVRIVLGRVEGSVYGGSINGNSTGNRWEVEGNEVEIINSDIKGDVYGGRLESNGGTKERIIRGNTVRIVGGGVEGSVYGGSGLGEGNVVELKGSPKFSKKTMIFGGGSGGILNIETRDQIVVCGITDFEKYNFNKVRVNEPAKIKAVGTSNYLMGFWKVDLEKAIVVGRVEGEVKEGDRVNLIEAEDGVTKAKSIEMYKGSGLVKLIHERVVGEAKKLSLEIKGQELTPQAQKITEVGATGLIVVGQGLGFLSEKGIEEAVRSVKEKRGVEVFGAVGGESSKYKSGIEMSIEGVRAVGGIAKSMEEGKVVVGGYVEHGKGDYKVEEVEGKGMTSYVGVGGLGRVMVGEEVYIDMSVGVGRQGIEFDGNGLNVLTKENIGYEDKGMYVGGHVGCGYKREVGET
jgi:hypothetical protein